MPGDRGGDDRGWDKGEAARNAQKSDAFRSFHSCQVQREGERGGQQRTISSPLSLSPRRDALGALCERGLLWAGAE